MPDRAPDPRIPHDPNRPAVTATRSRWSTLPPDLLEQSCKRIGIMALVFAGMWAIPLVLNNLVHDWVHRMHMDAMVPHADWPMPGNAIAGLGIGISLAVLVLARRLSGRPVLLLRLGLGFQVAQAVLVSFLMHLHPVTRQDGVSWLCIVILAYPSIVPGPPRTTLLVSLLIATLDPVFYAAAGARGEPVSRDAFVLLWQWLPTYASAVIAVVPSKILAGLGRQVNRARELGSYQLQQLLGRGGMGEVYQARHRFLARPAAIKLIRPELLGTDAGASVERFRREAQAAAVLRSPHTIDLYDFGITDDGAFYYVMELLEGLDFDTLVERYGAIPAGRVVHLLRQACHSLGEAHQRGLIHRDVKPSNLFTCRLGLNVDFVKVLDFGLVKSTLRDGPQSVILTAADVTTGTPAFMAPEMALGEGGVDARADLYALGCVGYWLLTGRLVFEAETPVKMMLQHIQAAPVPPSALSEVEIPAELDRAILACLAKKREDRPADMRELDRMLAAVPCARPWTAQRAEEWWDLHLPAPPPMSVWREETPLGTLRVKRPDSDGG